MNVYKKIVFYFFSCTSAAANVATLINFDILSFILTRFLPREVWVIEGLLDLRGARVSLATQGHGGQRERRVTVD